MKRVFCLATIVLVGSMIFGAGCSRSISEPSAAKVKVTPASPANEENTTATNEAGESTGDEFLETAAAAPPPDRYALPAGGVPELLAFIEGLQAYRPQSAEEYRDYQQKYPDALQTAAEKILSLEKDESSAAYKSAKLLMLQSRVANIRNASPEEQKVILSDLTSALESKADIGLSRADVSLAMSAARSLEHGGQPGLAADTYANVAAILAKHDNPEFARNVNRMEGAARRLRLPGNQIELQGKLLSGGELDWASYRGKVVLVDFWATWCGPCIAELPNVRKLYDSYHDRGFDVVGISLDSSRDALEKFLADDPLPWTTLYDDEAKGSHPLAEYYGVMGIPTALLVDKEGKVVSLNARGEELGKLLEQQLGAVAVAEAAPADAAP